MKCLKWSSIVKLSWERHQLGKAKSAHSSKNLSHEILGPKSHRQELAMVSHKNQLSKIYRVDTGIAESKVPFYFLESRAKSE